MRRAIKTHWRDFAAMIALFVLSLFVAGYILGNERLRVPFLSPSQFTINAEFTTAKAVSPGQGQTVDISGVKVGQIGAVTLKNGIAILRLDIDTKYKHVIHTDASALLRPRTGLEDMFVELDPGSASAPAVRPGFTIPLSDTLPTIESDEILSSLNADTRAYLDLLVNGAGQGLKGNGGTELAQVLERFEPTHRDLARLMKALATRGSSLSRVVNALQRLDTALAAKQVQIVQLVDASARVFRAFASEDQNVSRALADLPGTLSDTTAALTKVQAFAAALGPASANLLPAAEALPSANAGLTTLGGPGASSCGAGSTCAILRDQIRPFVRAARPLVQQLRPAAVNLANATPNLSKSFVTLNHLFNMLGYSPGGAQHGYLWWLAWLDHNVRTLFSAQDANSPFRQVFLQLTCKQLYLLTPPSAYAAVGGILGAPTAYKDSAASCAQADQQPDAASGGLPMTPLSTSYQNPSADASRRAASSSVTSQMAAASGGSSLTPKAGGH